MPTITEIKPIDFALGNFNGISLPRTSTQTTVVGTSGNDIMQLNFASGSPYIVDGGAGKDLHKGSAGNTVIYRFSSLKDSTRTAPDIIVNYPNDRTYGLTTHHAYKVVDLRALGVSSFSQLDVQYYLDPKTAGDYTFHDPYAEISIKGTNFMFIAYTDDFNEDDVIYVGEATPDFTHGNHGAPTVNLPQPEEDNTSVITENDTITGSAADDTLKGNVGDDSLLGGDGNDSLRGGQDNDFLQGNQGSDFCAGDLGNDTVRGGKDNDTVRGGKGDDLVAGDNGEDAVYGDLGNDSLRGGKEDDVLIGGEGNDTLWGDLGDDTLTGGDGTDIFAFQAGAGADVITDFQDGIDLLQFSSAIFANAEAAVAALSASTISLGSGNSVAITGLTVLGTEDIIIA